MLMIFKMYIKNRKDFGINTFGFYIRKIFFSIIITSVLVLIGINADEIQHSSISAALVSITAIIVAFLIFSMTVLFGKYNKKNIPNTDVKYVDILINNTEVLFIISRVSIIVNLIYMYFSSLEGSFIGCFWMNFTSCLAIFLTILSVNMAVSDMLFLSRSYYENRSNEY